MKKSKRIIALVIGVLMCLSLLAACKTSGTPTPSTSSNPPSSPSASNPASPSGSPSPVIPVAPPEGDIKVAEHLNVLIQATGIAVLNPHNPSGTGGAVNWAYRNYLDTLTYEEPSTLEILPCLAERWETDDYITFKFYLRNDAYFHNGEKFTADDVIFTHYASQTWGMGVSSYDVWNAIETITAPDDYTVIFKLKNMDVEFLSKIGSAYCCIVNREAVEADDVKGYLIGTGAYKCVSISSMDRVEFERNDDYWGELPLTKTQTWRTVPEASTRTIMMQNGEADVCFDIAEGDLQMFSENKDKFVMDSNVSFNPQAIQFNMTDPLCADLNFRMAVVHAIDREEVSLIARGELGGVAESEGTMWGYRGIYRNRNLPFLGYDLDKAKEYLAKTAYNGEEVQVLTSGIAFVKAAEVIQQQLNRIGIKVKVETMDMAGFFAATTWEENKAQILLWSQTLNQRTSSFRNNFYPGVTNNRSRYDNPELNELMDKDPTVPPGPEKEALCYRMQEIIAEDIPSVNLYYTVSNFVGAKGFGGVKPAATLWDLRYMYKEVDA